MNSHLDASGEEESDGYLQLCPDFAVEVRSKSDSLRSQMDKMTRRAYVYRPDCPVEVLVLCWTSDGPSGSEDPLPQG
ncbi:MAG: Uma2 family endonuclease [Acidobacteria bacterium]|nr:Uma2 family endonuclease [Acidobacteriota bacterium]